MTASSGPRVRPRPLLGVSDVAVSGAWYERVLDAESAYGGPDYARLLVDGEPVLQLHHRESGVGHGPIGGAGAPLGHGVLVWFETAEFDVSVRRVRDAGAEIVTDVRTNTNAGHREIWLRDPDGYVVVLSGE